MRSTPFTDSPMVLSSTPIQTTTSLMFVIIFPVHSFSLFTAYKSMVSHDFPTFSLILSHQKPHLLKGGPGAKNRSWHWRAMISPRACAEPGRGWKRMVGFGIVGFFIFFTSTKIWEKHGENHEQISWTNLDVSIIGEFSTHRQLLENQRYLRLVMVSVKWFEPCPEALMGISC